jgi:hypothetical protein
MGFAPFAVTIYYTGNAADFLAWRHSLEVLWRLFRMDRLMGDSIFTGGRRYRENRIRKILEITVKKSPPRKNRGGD